MADKYTREELVGKLDQSGWRAVSDHHPPAEGTLREVATAAHVRRAEGRAPSRLQEIETRIEVGMIELEELWHHLGLPV
jgi:hypothetical protein